MLDPYLELFSKTAFKQAVVAAPGGVPAPTAPPGGPPMMGGPMDPAMMGGMPPGGGGPPMDPAMMGGMPPPMDIPTEIANIKAMLQQLMDAQVAMMQALAPAGAMPPPTMPAGAPPMDPAMMGLPATPPPGMIAQASDESEDFTSFIRSVTELLR